MEFVPAGAVGPFGVPVNVGFSMGAPPSLVSATAAFVISERLFPGCKNSFFNAVIN